MLGFWIGEGRAEEDCPEVGEGRDVSGYDEVCEHCAEDVPGPDAAERKASFGFRGPTVGIGRRFGEVHERDG